VQCFSQQVVMNKVILPNPEKIWRRFVLLSSRKTKKKHSTLAHSNSEKMLSDVTELKATL